MANTLQQRAQQRKVIYAVLIMALFTVALLHRDNIIYAQADRLQLREVTRGQVELTSSLMRHTLSGLHGLGVTMLWSAAIEKQKKHEWNELELLVDSITRLQPYFITPWRFQGWNLAFNVSVECDRPVDKYYYITRGLTLLAKGERRNQGSITEKDAIGVPGNPDMRRDIGTFYQMKIGNSDDKYTMRCLLDMSCIDPLERRFDLTGLSGESITPVLREKLTMFCQKYPSLSRRIVEWVVKDTPKKFLTFLEDNKEVPSRYDSKNEGRVIPTPRKPAEEQWPILPPHKEDFWPNPEEEVLTDEAISVYLMSRTWFQYGQLPLPPADNYYDKVVDEKKRRAVIDQTKYRQARMADVIFRADPARAQSYFAETLQEEGWFDREGWVPPTTLLRSIGDPVGIAERYRSGPAWAKAYTMYRDFGTQTGLFLTPEQRTKLEELARVFRAQHSLREDQDYQPQRAEERDDSGFWAHLALKYSKQRGMMTNFDAHLNTAFAEATDEAVLARKLYYLAGKSWPSVPGKYFQLTEQANYVWLDVLLKNPRFAQVRFNQEDTYERQLKFFTRGQKDVDMLPVYRELLPLCAQLGECAPGQPYTPFYFIPWTGVIGSDLHNPKRFLSEQQIYDMVPMRTNIYGPFDMTQYYDSPRTPMLKEALFRWTAYAGLATSPLELSAMANPARYMGLMTRSALGAYGPLPPNSHWRFVIESESVGTVRSRLGLR